MEIDLKKDLDWPSDQKFSNVRNRPKIVVREGSWLVHTLWYEYNWKDTLKEFDITQSELKDIYESVRFHFLRWRNSNERWDSAIKKLIEKIQEKIESEQENNE